MLPELKAAADFTYRESGAKDTPALVLRTPPETNAKKIAAAAPHATLQMVPDCGHLPHLERPAVFNAAVLGE